MKWMAVLLMAGCAPTLQVALWQSPQGQYVATMRCSAGGQSQSAEVRSASLLVPHTPTEAQ